MMSPKAALAAKKEAEKEAQTEALRIKKNKVREMSAMASSFVIKQAFEVAFGSETSVTSDSGNQRFDINFVLAQGIGLQVRMPVELKIDKLQVYISRLVEKISKLKNVLSEAFIDQNNENNQIFISISNFSESQSHIATIKLDLNNLCAKSGNRISFNTNKEDFDTFISSIDQFAEAINNIDCFKDIHGEYELKYNIDNYKICLIKAISTVSQVKIPKFVSELCALSFQGCATLADISIPKSAECSGWPFSDCGKLKDIHLY